MKKTLYELVGVPPTAPRDIIGAACKRRIAKLEEEGGEEAKAAAYAIREAWSILGDDKQRAAYDASLAAPKAEAVIDPVAASFARQLAPDTLAATLVKPREVPRDWARIGKLVGGAGMILLAIAVWTVNQNARIQSQKRLEAAVYEAEHGPGATPSPAPKAEPAKDEPFSAAKAEQEMRAREAEARARVEADTKKQEDDFRRKLEQENGTAPASGRRSRRY